METKAVSLALLEADLKTLLYECADSGHTLIVERPDGRRVAFAPLDSAADDTFMSDLLEHNAAIRALLDRSSAGQRVPFDFEPEQP